LSLNNLDSDQARVILYPQIGGNNIVYQLKAVLRLRAELQNLIFPSTITSGSDPFVGPFRLGSVANPLELETFFFFTGRAYNDGTVVTLTAVPNSGWLFKEWTGDLSGSQNPKTLIMNSDKSVTATFKPDVAITRTANPTSVQEPGGDVEFTIEVTNNSLGDGTIDSLSDSDFDLASECADAVGTVLAPGENYTCTFTKPISGDFGDPDHVNTAEVRFSDEDGNTATESDDATVSFTE
jgi:hypothetical protein